MIRWIAVCLPFGLPCFTNRSLFLFSPWLTLLWSLLIWVIIPFGENQILCDLDLSIIFFFAVASLGSYGIIVSGWASNSKYALFGAVRSVSQMISYDVSIGILCWDLLMITSSLSLVHLVMQQQNISNLLVFPLLGVGWLISCLAETARAPFDLTEAETELIAGFHVELAGVGFTLFFLAEYSNIMTAAIFTILLFLGGFGVFESYDCYVKPVISVLFFMMIYRSLIHLVNNFHSNTPFNHSSR